MSEAAAAPLRHQNLPLTAIRGFAALWVVGHHLQFVLAYAGYDALGWLFRPGYVAVDIFFVLSGFVITAVHRDLTGRGLRNFFLRRIFRVYPLHLFVLALILGLWVWSEARFGAHDPTERLRDLPIVVLLLQPYLLHGLTWNTVSWSIGVELLCYALFPFLIGGLRRLEFIGCGLILLMMAAIERHVQSEMVWGWPAIARGLAGFGLGMAVQQMTVLVRRPRPRTASLVEIAAILAILLAVLGNHLRLIPVFAAVLIWGLAAERGVVARGLGAGWCVWLGRISFSLYLIHPTLIGLAFVWLPPGRLGLGHAADGVLWTLLMLSLLLGVATVTWAGVEGTGSASRCPACEAAGDVTGAGRGTKALSKRMGAVMKWFVPLLLGAMTGLVASGPSAMAAAGNPLVLELFTSQGCSSCPPADRYLGELKDERPDVLVLDFHIGYWDSLGWKDPFSLTTATDRQQTYDRLLGTNVYTPQLVIGGSREAVGSDRDGVTDAIAAAYRDRAGLPPVAMDVSARGSGIGIDVAAGSGSAQLWLVGYDDRHTTAIGRGENGGLTETEVDIVRSIRPIAAWNGGVLHLEVARPTGQRVALLLQQADGHIRAAARLD